MIGHRPLVLTMLLAALTHPADTPAEDPPAAPPRAHVIRVLLITGGHDFEHEAFLGVFRGHPDIQFKEVTQPDALKYFAPDKAGEYDVMVWYDLVQQIGEQDKKNLVALLEKGKPLVALHHCLANYQDWPEAGRILGGRYWMKKRPGHEGSTFKHNQRLAVRIADPDHPITRFMKDFEIEDEAYGNLEVLPGSKPLLSVDHPPSLPLQKGGMGGDRLDAHLRQEPGGVHSTWPRLEGLHKPELPAAGGAGHPLVGRCAARSQTGRFR